MNLLRISALVLGLALLGASAQGCNTMRGVGQDIRAVGESISGLTR